MVQKNTPSTKHPNVKRVPKRFAKKAAKQARARARKEVVDG